MSFCRNCGAELRIGARFCRSCGASVAPSAAERRIERRERRPISTLSIFLIVFAVAVVVLTVILIPGFWSWKPSGTVTGSGNLVSEEMDFSDFTSIEIGNAFEAEITRSDSYSVKVTMDDNLFDYIKASKEGEKLEIRLESGYNYKSVTLRVQITMPELYELRFSGATHGSVEGFSSSQKFIVDLYGASYLDMDDMSTGDVEIELSGASRVTGSITSSGDAKFTSSGASKYDLEGSADDLRIDASGASNLELSNFQVHDANVELSGASQATVNLDGRLDGDLSGASQLLYVGEPTLGEIDKSSDSTVRKK